MRVRFVGKPITKRREMLKLFKKTESIRCLFLSIIFCISNAQCKIISSDLALRIPPESYTVSSYYSERKSYVDLPVDSDPITLFSIEVPDTARTGDSTQPFTCWVNLLYIADVHDVSNAVLQTGQSTMTLLFYVKDDDFYCSMLYNAQSTFTNLTHEYTNESLMRFIEPEIDTSTNIISVKIQNNTGLDAFSNKTFTAIGTLKNQYAYISVGHNGPINDIHEINTLITFENPIIFNSGNPTLDGQFLTYQFVKTDLPLMITDIDITAVTENIILKDFSPDYIELGAGSELIFGDQTTIELNDNQELNYTWTFSGNCKIDGNGYALTLGDLGNIILEHPFSSLTFNNVILKGVSGTNIRCVNNAGELSFRLAKIVLSDDFNFNTGSFSILDQCAITGGNSFNYFTNQTSVINNSSCLSLERNSSFYYAPSIASNSLLNMTSDSASLKLSGASLSVTTTGLNLANGTIMIKNKCPFYNDGASSLSQAIILGSVDILPGGSIDLRSGIIDYSGEIV
ncbi:MAG: hypothetical protein US49_C0007G0048 [candidate division TM6 bacterium GW2011_GWF2_37_49]|nr:MAG: hypothetical protein US49_C0007G0048 [candidate division TM6 bacterium GW2011_GWF2_37_49]